jgi:CRISPR/Cas system-associated exonuclease Cas4 (RecB family)
MRWSYFKCLIPEKERLNVAMLKAGREAEEVALRYLLKKYKVRRCKNKEAHFNDFSIVGRADFILNGQEIVEVKNSKWLRKPELRWFAQLNIYLFLENVESGMLLEVGQKTIRETKMGFSPKLLRVSLRYFSELQNFITNNRTPEIRESRYCRFCSYGYLCREFW